MFNFIFAKKKNKSFFAKMYSWITVPVRIIFWVWEKHILPNQITNKLPHMRAQKVCVKKWNHNSLRPSTFRLVLLTNFFRN